MRRFGILLATALVPMSATPLSASKNPLGHPQDLCDYHSLHGDSFLAAEAECIKAAGKGIEKSGDVLTLKARNGTNRSFTGNAKACEEHDAGKCRVFLFMGYVPNFDVFVVLGECYEFCHDVHVVDASTGALIELEGLPYFSPDRTRFVSVFALPDVEAPKFPDVQVFERTDGGIKRVFSHSRNSEYEAWQRPTWIGNGMIDLEATFNGSPWNAPSTSAAAKLMLMNGRWGFATQLPRR
jgi:hypothetical protein